MCSFPSSYGTKLAPVADIGKLCQHRQMISKISDRAGFDADAVHERAQKLLRIGPGSMNRWCAFDPFERPFARCRARIGSETVPITEREYRPDATCLEQCNQPVRVVRATVAPGYGPGSERLIEGGRNKGRLPAMGGKLAPTNAVHLCRRDAPVTVRCPIPGRTDQRRPAKDWLVDCRP